MVQSKCTELLACYKFALQSLSVMVPLRSGRAFHLCDLPSPSSTKAPEIITSIFRHLSCFYIFFSSMSWFFLLVGNSRQTTASITGFYFAKSIKGSDVKVSASQPFCYRVKVSLRKKMGPNFSLPTHTS